MRILKKISIVLFLLLTARVAIGQMPAKQMNSVGFRKAVYGGVVLHTQGYGATFGYSKFKTFLKKRLYSLDLVLMKHPKEFKIIGDSDKNAKGFVYGKLNSFFVLRPGIGIRKVKFEKIRDNGVEVNFSWLIGPSLGFAKPEYLKVLSAVGNSSLPKEERYDPEIHNLSNIYGRASSSRGLGEMKLYPGAFIKGSVTFEYSSESDQVKAIELGAAVDVYTRRVPIMTLAKNSFIYPTVYINILFGKKFI